MYNTMENYETELFNKYNGEAWESDADFMKQAEQLTEDDVRRKSDEIKPDKMGINGEVFKHTGYEIWIGRWLYEYYCKETNDTIYA